MNVYAHQCGWTDEKHKKQNYYGCSPYYLWEGTNEQPIHDRMNTTFFEKYDKVIENLFNVGINVHLYFKVYNKMVNWPKKYSKEDDLFFEYITARYQAYCNIIWDFSKTAFLKFLLPRLALKIPMVLTAKL